MCGRHFPGNCRHLSPQRGVHGVVNLGGVVKTLRRSNSLSRTVFSTAGSFGLRSRRPGTGPENGNARKVLAGMLAQVLAKMRVLAQVLAGPGPLGKQKQTACQHSGQHPHSWPAPVPAPPPALFWNSHFQVLYQVAGISNLPTKSKRLTETRQIFSGALAWVCRSRGRDWRSQ